ncbi:MAG: HlyD family type I secretion periplasmic adaptor subunit, partial [Pseudomonadota bacterium]
MTPMTPQQDTLMLEEYHLVTETTDEPRIGRFILLGLIVLVGFVGGALVWANQAKLDGAVVAPASLVVEGNRKTLQHLDGGIVSELNVSDGDYVEAGQTLLQLDSTETEVDLGVLGSQFGDLTMRQARLEAQLDGSATFPLDLEAAGSQREDVRQSLISAFQTQHQLFETERRARQSEAKIAQRRIASLEQEIAGISEQRDANTRQIAITDEEIAAVTSLLKKGLISKRRVNALRIEIERLNGLDASLRTSQARAQNQIGELQLEELSRRRQRDEVITSELALVEGQLATVTPRYLAAIERQRRISVTAPASGRVVNLAVFTKGAVIRPGAAILDIVPSDEELIVEARINPTDIEKLRIGQDTRIRLTAFDQEAVPEAEGRIIDISADNLIDERSGNAYFVARVRLDRDQPGAVDALDLLPGMPAD